MKTYRITYFSGRSRTILAANYTEAVILAHRTRSSQIADIEEITA